MSLSTKWGTVHIGKIITLNTPHFGSELAVKNSTNIANSVSGLNLIIDDLNSQENGETQIHELITADLNLNWYSYASEVAVNLLDEYINIWDVDDPQAILGSLFPFVGILGWTYGALTDWATDVTLTVKGPYIGEYAPEIYIDVVGPFNQSKELDTIKTMAKVSKEARKIRKAGAHLDKESPFMEQLGHKYPQRPDSSNIKLLPLYSPSTKRFLAELLHLLSEEANELCAKNDERKECFAVADYFEIYALKMGSDRGVNDVSNIEFNDTLWQALLDIQNNWLSKSDLAVSEYSQKFEEPSFNLSSEFISEFQKPRPYIYHNALAPWEDVLHMPVKGLNDGATKQGLDIACALDFYCNELLLDDSAKMIYLEQGQIGLTGDFEIAPTFLESGKQEVKISDGSNYLKASYIPEIGSIVSYTDYLGNIVQDTILGSSISTNPSLTRENQNIIVSFNNYSGKKFAKTYKIPQLSETVSYSIDNGNSNIFPKVVVGIANVTDSSTQIPPSPPKDKFFTKSSIFAMHREAREEHEGNVARPRIFVANTSDSDINGFKVAYYFTAD